MRIRASDRQFISGYRVEEIKDPLIRQVRYLEKLVDELAKARQPDFPRF
ncbi:DUF2200 family protein [bacterium]|nr:DUF2200 family protein [bacterium]